MIGRRLWWNAAMMLMPLAPFAWHSAVAAQSADPQEQEIAVQEAEDSTSESPAAEPTEEPATEPAPAADAIPEAPPAAGAPQLDPFPVPETLQGNLEFWIWVFSEWSTNQAAIHDSEYPALVFEVVELPGSVGDRYSEEQKAFLDRRVQDWRNLLLGLASKAAGGLPMDDLEKAWALEVIAHAGAGGLEGAADRLRTQRGLRERFRQGLERSTRYDAHLRQAFRDAGLPEDLAYLPHVESSFHPGARSSAGAVGLWQFTRGAGKRYLAIDSSIDERLDPIASGRGAARYLQDAFNDLGSWPLALTSYNHGVEGMLRAKRLFGTDFERIYREYKGPLFGFASRNFYAEFLAARQIARNPQPYFPEGFDAHPPLDHDQVVLPRRMTAGQISKTYGIPVAQLASLNVAWTRRALRSGVAFPAGTHVWLPAGTVDRSSHQALRAVRPSAGTFASEGSYIVQPGDTLSSIAQTVGIDVERLRSLNGISGRGNLIHAGQKLKVQSQAPAASGVHVVRAGETLSGIAQGYGVSLSQLRQLNGMTAHKSIIQVGQRLRVPAGASPTDTATYQDKFHIVKRGETLLRIATSYGVSLLDLLSANNLSAHSIIRPGQNIRIPTLR